MTFKHIADYTLIQRTAGFGRQLRIRQIVFCFKCQKMALLLRAKYRAGDNLLALEAENNLPYPQLPAEARRALDEGVICDMFEGHAPYKPRYVLPDSVSRLADKIREKATTPKADDSTSAAQKPASQH